jgi:hypothetical protein
MFMFLFSTAIAATTAPSLDVRDAAEWTRPATEPVAAAALVAAHDAEFVRCQLGAPLPSNTRRSTHVVLHLNETGLSSVEVVGNGLAAQIVGLCIADSALSWTDLPAETGWVDLWVVAEGGLGSGAWGR